MSDRNVGGVIFLVSSAVLVATFGVVAVIVSHKDLVKGSKTAENDKICPLSLVEFIQKSKKDKFCSVSHYEDHTVDWKLPDLRVVSTGAFYQTPDIYASGSSSWQVSVFVPTEPDCDCVPELPATPCQYYRVQGMITSLYPGSILLRATKVEPVGCEERKIPRLEEEISPVLSVGDEKQP